MHVHMYMEIQVYSTVAYIQIGREERQPIQIIYMHVPVHMYMYVIRELLYCII